MKFAVGSLVAALAILPALQAGPGRVDASKRAPVSTEQRAVLPETQPLERNEVLMDRRFEGQEFERKEAPVGDRRSTIELEESREKTLFPTPDQKEYELLERKDSPWSGKESRFSTREDAYRTQVAERFQDKIGDASPFPGTPTPVVSKRTTFDRINRFAFRKNGDQSVAVMSAGSEQAARDASGASSPGAAGSGEAQSLPAEPAPSVTPFSR
jgi:hypothetical protein